MIQILPCPECEKPTVFPEGVSLEATIRCPSCAKQFVVGEMLNSQMGYWEVIHDPAAVEMARDASGEEHGASPAASGEVAETDDHPDELKLAVEDTPTEAVHQRQPDWSEFKLGSHGRYRQMRRKQRLPLGTILQVALGGVAAVPIGLLLIWHVVGTDVAGAGPLVGQYAPWIVPEKFRPYKEEFDSLSNGTPPTRGASGFRKFDDLVPIDSGQKPEDDPSLVTDPTQENSPGSTIQTRPMPSGDGAVEKDPAVAPSERSATSEKDSPPDNLGGQNIFSLIDQCDQDLNAWIVGIESGSADLKQLAQVVFEDLTRLAVLIDELPDGNPVLRTVGAQMQSIGKTVKRLEHVQSLVRQGSRFWTNQREDSTDYGLAMVVDVEAAEKTDQVWKLRVSAESELGSPPIEIEVPRALAPSLDAGQRLWLLGMVRSASPSEQGAPSPKKFTACYVYGL